MNLTKSIKTGALAVAVLLATAGASFAAQYAWVDQDANVKKKHLNASVTVNWVKEGQKVKIVGSWGNWYKIQIPGPDGWVKKGVLDFAPDYDDDYGYGYGGGHVCINGQYGSLCIGN